MNLVSTENYPSFRTLDGFAAIDFPLPDARNLNASEITLTRRFPEKGRKMNTKSEMLVRMLQGSATLHQEGSEKAFLIAGDIVLVEINKPYYWEVEKVATFFVVSSPPWTPDQNVNVD